MKHYGPFSSVWGNVTQVRSDQKNKGCILVTIAGQVLRLQRTGGDGIQELGLLRLTKKNQRIFLIFEESITEGRHIVFAGWNNPDSKIVRILQAVIAEGPDFHKMVRATQDYFPAWKYWNQIGGDEFVEVGEEACF